MRNLLAVSLMLHLGPVLASYMDIYIPNLLLAPNKELSVKLQIYFMFVSYISLNFKKTYIFELVILYLIE